MVTFETVKYIRKFEERILKLGLKMVPYQWSSSVNYICLVPLDDNYPSYTREAVIASGTMEELNEFLNGLEWAKQYYRDTLRLYTDAAVVKKEQSIRNRILMNRLGDKKDDSIDE